MRPHRRRRSGWDHLICFDDQGQVPGKIMQLLSFVRSGHAGRHRIRAARDRPFSTAAVADPSPCAVRFRTPEGGAPAKVGMERRTIRWRIA